MYTRFPNDQFGSSAKSLEPDAPRSGIERLKTAAVEFAWTVILIAGSIMAALFALDLMEMLRW
jgi:hypothetical protein